jgi:Uma2 family endonuclease
MDAPPKPEMTEAEFVAWALATESVRAEWEGGKVVMMATVSAAEDDLNGWLIGVLRSFCEHHDLGVVKGPQFMVRFGRQRRRRMPDVMFVAKARQHLIRDTHLEGAPDVAFEIVSADSQSRDRRKKFLEYQKEGVREYWMIDPLSRQVEVYALQRGKYVAVEEGVEGEVRSTVLKGFFINPAQLWRQPLPKLAAMLKGLGIR